MSELTCLDSRHQLPRVTSWLQLGNLLITMGEFCSGAETSKLRVKLDYRQQVMMGEMLFFVPKRNVLSKHLGNAEAWFFTGFRSHFWDASCTPCKTLTTERRLALQGLEDCCSCVLCSDESVGYSESSSSSSFFF